MPFLMTCDTLYDCMCLANRAERVPAWLFGVDCLLCLAFVPFALISGPEIPILAFALVFLAYALGGFDVLSLTRHQSSRAPFLALIAVTLAYTGVVVVRATVESFVARDLVITLFVYLSLLLLAFVHTLLRSFLARGVQQVTLVLPRRMAHWVRTVEHHVTMSGYPATIVLNGPGCEGEIPSAIIENPRIDPGDTAHVVQRSFDLVRFFDVALRVIPPDLVTIQPSFLTGRMDAGAGYLLIKRMTDVALALLMMVATAPLWIVAGIGILISDGRPLFFSQLRVGPAGSRFRIIKYRTLTAPQPNASPHDIRLRAFPFGAWLRRSRIDELPQLLMILRGSMSFVGPRPEMEYFHDRSKDAIPHYAERLRAKPGLTGWAQIRYSHTTTEDEYRDKTAFDLWYVVHRGILLDLKIMIRTMGTLVNRFGSR